MKCDACGQVLVEGALVLCIRCGPNCGNAEFVAELAELKEKCKRQDESFRRVIDAQARHLAILRVSHDAYFAAAGQDAQDPSAVALRAILDAQPEVAYVAPLFEELYAVMHGQGANNYVTSTVLAEGKNWVLTLQRPEGMTPIEHVNKFRTALADLRFATREYVESVHGTDTGVAKLNTLLALLDKEDPA